MQLPSLDLPLALFLDFDGGLADASSHHLPQGGREILLRLSMKLGGAVAVTSRLKVSRLSRRVPSALWRVGAEGLDIRPPRAAAFQTRRAPEMLAVCGRDLERQLPGVRAELRGLVLMLTSGACHTSDDLRHHAQEALRWLPGYLVRISRDGVELAPIQMNTGSALRLLMSRRPFLGRLPVTVGKGSEFEDAILISLNLGGFAVHVGTGPTLAPATVSGPSEVWAWLDGTGA